MQKELNELVDRYGKHEKKIKETKLEELKEEFEKKLAKM